MNTLAEVLNTARTAQIESGDILTVNGRAFRVTIEPDDTNDAPWGREDGHGPVRHVTALQGMLARAETAFRNSDHSFEFTDTGASIRDSSGLPIITTPRAPKDETETRIIRAMLAFLAFPNTTEI